MSYFSVKITLTIFVQFSFVLKSTYAHSDWYTLECTPISDVLSNGFAKLPILGSVCTETRGPNVWLGRSFVRVFVWCCPCVCSCIFVAFSILFVDKFYISFLISATVMPCVCLCNLQQVCSWVRSYVFDVGLFLKFILIWFMGRIGLAFGAAVTLTLALLWLLCLRWFAFDFGFGFVHSLVLIWPVGLDLVFVLIFRLFASLVQCWSWIYPWRWFAFAFGVTLHLLLALLCIHFWHWFTFTFAVHLTLVFNLAFGVRLILILVLVWFCF